MTGHLQRGRFSVVPLSRAEADAFIRRWHRHHDAAVGDLFRLGLLDSEQGAICAVAQIGRPVSRMLQNGLTCEITRLATDGSEHAASALYRAAIRAAMALGYKRVLTYTLPHEGGASLRAAGLRVVGTAGGGSWSRPSRPRVDTHPTQQKLRWENDSLMDDSALYRGANARSPQGTGYEREMAVDEFWRLGLIQEINRRLLHPLGLALSVIVEDGTATGFGVIWDGRDDPEGFRFSDDEIASIDTREKYARFEAAWMVASSRRMALLGYMVQPVPEAIEEP